METHFMRTTTLSLTLLGPLALFPPGCSDAGPPDGAPGETDTKAAVADPVDAASTGADPDAGISVRPDSESDGGTDGGAPPGPDAGVPEDCPEPDPSSGPLASVDVQPAAEDGAFHISFLAHDGRTGQIYVSLGQDSSVEFMSGGIPFWAVTVDLEQLMGDGGAPTCQAVDNALSFVLDQAEYEQKGFDGSLALYTAALTEAVGPETPLGAVFERGTGTSMGCSDACDYGGRVIGGAAGSAGAAACCLGTAGAGCLPCAGGAGAAGAAIGWLVGKACDYVFC